MLATPKCLAQTSYTVALLACAIGFVARVMHTCKGFPGKATSLLAAAGAAVLDGELRDSDSLVWDLQPR